MQVSRRLFTALTATTVASAGLNAYAQTPAASPVAGEMATRVFHGARITADLPADMMMQMGAEDTFVGASNTFTMASSTPMTSIDALADGIVVQTGANKPEDIDLNGTPAKLITGGEGTVLPIPATIVVAPYPEPFARGEKEMNHVLIEVSPEIADAVIPTISKDMTAVTPQTYVSSVLDIARTNSLFANEIDFDSFEEGIESHVTDMDSAHVYLEGPVRDGFRNVGDNHTHFVGTAESAEEATPMATAIAATSDVPTGNLLDDGTLVLTIPGTDGSGAGDYMRAARTLIADATAETDCLKVILDLRSNGGGSVYPMIGAIAPLLPEGDVFGYSYPQVDFVKMMTMEEVLTVAGTTDDLPASDLDLSGVPVAVLFGPNTASSGELSAISFIGRENAQSFGMESAGYTTANTTFHLLDGWMFNIASSLLVDRAGTEYGHTLTPDNEVDFSEEQLGTADDPVIASAQSWLQGQSCAVPAGTPHATPAS